jgi:hypothetical protein
MPRKGFHLQTYDQSIIFVPMNTDFGVFARTDDFDDIIEGEYVVAAMTAENDFPLYAGSEAECMEYLERLPNALIGAGLSVVLAQSVLPSQLPDPEDHTRWGKQ